MSALLEIQTGIATAVLTGNTAAVEQAIAADGLSAAARLGIYRNHFLVSLIDGLAATYPVVARLVGDSFFRAAARRFVQECPPRSPCLPAYGASFAEWLDSLPEAATLPYLPDVARLEWALAAASVAEDAPVLSPTALAAVGENAADVAFHLHPAVSLVASVFPIDRIWRANQPCACDAVVDLRDGGVNLIIRRHDGEVGWHALSRSDFAIVTALARGSTLANAAAEGSAAGGTTDLAALLAFLLDGEFLVSFFLDNRQEYYR